MNSIFKKAVAFTLKHEGGLGDDPDDYGGLTNFGITQTFLESINDGMYPVYVNDLTKKDAESIYFDYFWRYAPCSTVSDPKLQIVLFDTGVNFRLAGCCVFIQEALGLNMDGVFSKTVKKALIDYPDKTELAERIVANRIVYRYQRVREDPTQEKFLEGWLDRDKELGKYIKNIEDIMGSISPTKLGDFIKYFIGLPGQVKGIKALLSSIDVEKLHAIVPEDMLSEDAQWIKDYRNNAAPTKPNGYIKLDVPFYPQTDNYTMPDRTCNSSACAMAAKFLGANISGDDEYLRTILEKFGDSPDHAAQTKCLEYYGIKSTWNTDLGYADLDRSLKNGKPVVIAILHRGSETAPTGGHVIVVIGKTEAGDYIVNDPYGTIGDMYSSDVHNGFAAVYSRKTLNARWMVEGAQSGWGRIFD